MKKVNKDPFSNGTQDMMFLEHETKKVMFSKNEYPKGGFVIDTTSEHSNRGDEIVNKQDLTNLTCKYDTIHKTNITVEGLDNLHNE